jgi:hypothetical protein
LFFFRNSLSTIKKVDHSSSPILCDEEDQSVKQTSTSNQSETEKSSPLNSSPFNYRTSTENESSFVPINSTMNGDEQIPSTSSKLAGSIGHSHHTQFALQ